jgi:hypothetical protein
MTAPGSEDDIRRESEFLFRCYSDPESNWVQTVPGKGWNTLLRLYSPLEPWFDKTWRPGEIEPQP